MKTYKPRWLAYPLTALLYIGAGVAGMIDTSIEFPTAPIVFIIAGVVSVIASIVYFINMRNNNDKLNDVAKYLHYLSIAIIFIGIIFFNTRS